MGKRLIGSKNSKNPNAMIRIGNRCIGVITTLCCDCFSDERSGDISQRGFGLTKHPL